MPLLVTIDASVFVDAYAGRERREKSLKLLEELERMGAEIVEPRLVIVEVTGVLVRYIGKREAAKAANLIEEASRLIREEEIWETARMVALETGSRAADAYYISVALQENTTLITSDRPQHQSAQRMGVRSIYLPDVKDVQTVFSNTHL